MAIFAVVAIVGTTHAAAFDWKTSAGQYVYQSGTSTKLSWATAYLFDASVVSQATLLAGLLAEGESKKSITDFTSLSTATTTSIGSISAPSFEGGAVGEALTAYFAIVDGDKVFISSTAKATGPAVGSGTLQFKSLNTASKGTATEFSGTVSGAGWYTAAAVPEPASGILLLVGLAGITLRRRRARLRRA